MRDKSFIRETLSRRDAVRALGLYGTALLLQGCLNQSDVSQLVSVQNLQRLTGANQQRFTEQDEIQMGKTLYGPTIDQAGGPYQNAEVQRAMQAFAVPLFAGSSRPELPWEVIVLDDNTLNAWALPGGKLAVNRGLLRYVATEDELAAVLAHEMGHVEKSHAVNEIASEQRTRDITEIGKELASSKMSTYTARVPGTSELTREALGQLQGPLVKLATSGYSRTNEFEADQHILGTFGRSGYDPARSYTFFETLLQLLPPTTQQLKASAGRAAPPAARSGNSDAYAQLKRAFPTRFTPVELPKLS
jgi:beta-barrel assembly-enhancing protease